MILGYKGEIQRFVGSSAEQLAWGLAEKEHAVVFTAPGMSCEGIAGALVVGRELPHDKGITMVVDFRAWSRHDGVTEWADCSRCGAHLDPVSDASAPGHDWDGGCYICGAPPSEVGLRH